MSTSKPYLHVRGLAWNVGCATHNSLLDTYRVIADTADEAATYARSCGRTVKKVEPACPIFDAGDVIVPWAFVEQAFEKKASMERAHKERPRAFSPAEAQLWRETYLARVSAGSIGSQAIQDAEEVVEAYRKRFGPPCETVASGQEKS